MWRLAALLCLALSLATTGATAQERVRLGFGFLFNNDELGDGSDRWRTGSFSSSRVWGREWQGKLPDRLGEMLELRLGGQILTGESLRFDDPRDRPYAGALSAGLFTHAEINGLEYSLGANLVLTGPATGLDGFQEIVHDILHGPEPSDAVRAGQIANGLHPTGVAEIGRVMSLGAQAHARPFGELRIGDETLARIGVDLSFGPMGTREFQVRDTVTGHRYRVIRDDWVGVNFVLGADIAYVEHSIYLPNRRGPGLRDVRTRVRGGVHVQGKSGASLFYGLTWLSEEFSGQRESQLLGSVQFRIIF